MLKTQDNTVCCGTDCPFSYNCYRFIPKPVHLWQEYFEKVPYNKELNKCDKQQSKI